MVDVFRADISAKEFRKAFLLIDAVTAYIKNGNTEDVEGGAAYEVYTLFCRTAEDGKQQWAQILADPDIELPYKIALVESIDENVKSTSHAKTLLTSTRESVQ